jgi:hypothetical protein
MDNKTNKWKLLCSGYWINQDTNWVVKEIGREDDEQWVIIDERGMMISCEWKDNKKDCMKEADSICMEEITFQ